MREFVQQPYGPDFLRDCILADRAGRTISCSSNNVFLVSYPQCACYFVASLLVCEKTSTPCLRSLSFASLSFCSLACLNKSLTSVFKLAISPCIRFTERIIVALFCLYVLAVSSWTNLK